MFQHTLTIETDWVENCNPVKWFKITCLVIFSYIGCDCLILLCSPALSIRTIYVHFTKTPLAVRHIIFLLHHCFCLLLVYRAIWFHFSCVSTISICCVLISTFDWHAFVVFFHIFWPLNLCSCFRHAFMFSIQNICFFFEKKGFILPSSNLRTNWAEHSFDVISMRRFIIPNPWQIEYNDPTASYFESYTFYCIANAITVSFFSLSATNLTNWLKSLKNCWYNTL